MSVNERLVETTPERVWEVLADGWLYPTWVVGASRVRDVDAGWPAVGTKIHHSVGSWPCLIDDYTEVLEALPNSYLLLRARAWPMGEAHVAIDLSATGPDTNVVMTETVARGPGKLVPAVLREPALSWRNVETLRRLALVAVHRHMPA